MLHISSILKFTYLLLFTITSAFPNVQQTTITNSTKEVLDQFSKLAGSLQIKHQKYFDNVSDQEKKDLFQFKECIFTKLGIEDIIKNSGSNQIAKILFDILKNAAADPENTSSEKSVNLADLEQCFTDEQKINLKGLAAVLDLDDLEYFEKLLTTVLEILDLDNTINFLRFIEYTDNQKDDSVSKNWLSNLFIGFKKSLKCFVSCGKTKELKDWLKYLQGTLTCDLKHKVIDISLINVSEQGVNLWKTVRCLGSDQILGMALGYFSQMRDSAWNWWGSEAEMTENSDEQYRSDGFSRKRRSVDEEVMKLDDEIYVYDYLDTENQDKDVIVEDEIEKTDEEYDAEYYTINYDELYAENSTSTSNTQPSKPLFSKNSVIQLIINGILKYFDNLTLDNYENWNIELELVKAKIEGDMCLPGLFQNIQSTRFDEIKMRIVDRNSFNLTYGGDACSRVNINQRRGKDHDFDQVVIVENMTMAPEILVTENVEIPVVVTEQPNFKISKNQTENENEISQHLPLLKIASFTIIPEPGTKQFYIHLLIFAILLTNLIYFTYCFCSKKSSNSKDDSQNAGLIVRSSQNDKSEILNSETKFVSTTVYEDKPPVYRTQSQNTITKRVDGLTNL